MSDYSFLLCDDCRKPGSGVLAVVCKGEQVCAACLRVRRVHKVEGPAGAGNPAFRPQAALLLCWHNGLILAVSRRGKPEDLGLPGGKLHFGEAACCAAVREAGEECGAEFEHRGWSSDPTDHLRASDSHAGLNPCLRVQLRGSYLGEDDRELRLVYQAADGTPSGRLCSVYEVSFVNRPVLSLERRESIDRSIAVRWITPARLSAACNFFAEFNRALLDHLLIDWQF